jgi:hypothetical protein
MSGECGQRRSGGLPAATRHAVDLPAEDRATIETARVTLPVAKIERTFSLQLETFIESLGGSLGYTFSEAAQLIGSSDDALRLAAGRGELAVSYADSKPVIRAAELRRWVAYLPAEQH